MNKSILHIICFFLLAAVSQAQTDTSFRLTDQNSELKVLINNGILNSEIFHNAVINENTVINDANFRIDVFRTAWRSPGRANNSDNQCFYSKKDFHFLSAQKISNKDFHILKMKFEGKNNGLELTLEYLLPKGKNYYKRKISISDPHDKGHFLQSIAAYATDFQFISKNKASKKSAIRIESSSDYSTLESTDERKSSQIHIVHPAAYGQPIALTYKNTGFFFGLEYPACENKLEIKGSSFFIESKEDFGKTISREGISTDYTVIALCGKAVKQEFMTYINDMRYAPVRPYTLYNSWYDLRSVEYPNVPEKHFMNEKNVMRIIDLVDKNMIQKHGIRLDAFVLDDGWDIYDSDWKLRTKQFPNGFKPIAQRLEQTQTDLGIWFGPTGGYSFRSRRIEWMKANGYEVNGDQLCLAGKNYSRLFEKRVTDLVRNDDVRYFKWDGIQFSCSDPTHGHAVGKYSRRAVLDATKQMCEAARQANPDVYLNITSGTWLSPWWLKMADQIWMDGQDFAYADVPSVSPRDAAITYRDMVLWEDFQIKDLWFPVSSLMTHGIIKGNLQKLGGESEPLDKFTDNALLYCARGVSMYELYISPDILNDDEWFAISQSLKWARNRFDILMNTEMRGGNPQYGKTYAYVHFKDDEGIIAARNPIIENQSIRIKLDPEAGISTNAKNLVVEQVYPIHQILPDFYAAGAELEIDLNGFETAVFEIYPLSKAGKPLLAGISYHLDYDGNICHYKLFERGREIKILNPESIKKITIDGKDVGLSELNRINPGNNSRSVDFYDIQKKVNQKDITISINMPNTVNQENGQLAVLIRSASKYKGQELPVPSIRMNNQDPDIKAESQKGVWAWYPVALSKGEDSKIEIIIPRDGSGREIEVSLWQIGLQKIKSSEMTIESNNKPESKITPPRPYAADRKKIHKKIQTYQLNL